MTSNPNLDDELAEELRRALTPVRPPEVFRDHLRNNLKLAGDQQKVRRGMRRRRGLDWTNWWIVGALMGGSIAAGSVLAYLIRSRILYKQPA